MRRGTVVVGALLAALVVAWLLGRNGTDGPRPELPDLEAGSDEFGPVVNVSPVTALLTERGQTRQLSAVAVGFDGPPTIWESSRPDVVSVDQSGMLEAASNLGSALVTARIGDVWSAPVLVVVADPVDDAVLVDDADIVAGPDGLATPLESFRYRVRIAGISAPRPGTAVIATGEAEIGGLVVEATEDGNEVELVLEPAAPGELFDAVEIDETLDLRMAPVEIADALTDHVITKHPQDGTWTFEPSGQETEGRAAPRIIPAQLKNEYPLGPLVCETTLPRLPIRLNQPVSVSVQPNLSFSILVRNQLERLVVSGTPTADFTLRPTVEVGFEAKVECKLPILSVRIPIGGWLAVLFSGKVPIGVGAELEGKVTLAQAGYELTGSVSAPFEFGVVCPPGGDCSMVHELDPMADVAASWVIPDPNSQFRFEPSLFGFAFADLTFGPTFTNRFTFEALELKAGLAQKASLADAATQVADDNYASDYAVILNAEIEAGGTLSEWLSYLNLRVLKTKFEFSQPVRSSPTGSAVADQASYEAGQRVDVTITLTGDLFYPVVGYNVEEVRLYRRTAAGDAEELASTPASDGQEIFELQWTADQSFAVADGTLFAFVETRLFGLVPLELARVGGGVSFRPDNPNPVPDPDLCTRSDVQWIASFAQQFYPHDAYSESWCHLATLNCSPDDRMISGERVFGFTCTFDAARHSAYIARCGNTLGQQIERGCTFPD